MQIYTSKRKHFDVGATSRSKGELGNILMKAQRREKATILMLADMSKRKHDVDTQEEK